MPAGVWERHPQAERTRALRRDEPARAGRDARVPALERPPVLDARGLLEHVEQERLDQLVADCLIANAHCGSVDATSTIRWVRQFGTQRYDLANAAAPDGKGWLVYRRVHELLARWAAVPPPIRRVPHPVRRGRRRAVDPAVRHERDRSGARDLGLGDRCTSWVQPTGGSPGSRRGRDRRVRRPVQRRGRLMWLKQFGTHRDDESAAVSASADAILLAGTTRGPLDQQRLDGPSDAFVMRLETNGLPSWTKVLGGTARTGASSVALREGQVFLAGPRRACVTGSRTRTGSSQGSICAVGLRGAIRSASRTPTRSRRSSRAPRASISRGGPRGVLGRAARRGVRRGDRQARGRGPAVVQAPGSATDDQATALSIAGKGLYVTGSTTGELGPRHWERATASSASTCRTAPRSGPGSSARRTTTRSTAWPRPEGRGRRRDHARGVRGPDERR